MAVLKCRSQRGPIRKVERRGPESRLAGPWGNRESPDLAGVLTAARLAGSHPGVSRRRGHVRVRLPQGVLRGGAGPGEPFLGSETGEGTRARNRRGRRGRGSRGRSQPTLPPRQRVLLFVASDVDALCACKILQVRPAGPAGARGGAGRELGLGRGLPPGCVLGGTALGGLEEKSAKGHKVGTGRLRWRDR